MTENDEVLRASLNAETARIAWLELQTFFARGKVIHVDATLDLVEVALCVAKNDQIAVTQWMGRAMIGQVSDDTAKGWFQRNPSLWAVVVAPWILVQEKDH